MSKEFQVPVVSGFHSIMHLDPAIKVCPGPGAVGMTWAMQRIGNIKRLRGTSIARLRAAMMVKS